MSAICFDLDGTLTDPKVGITRSIQFALRELGRDVPDADELNWCIGPPLLQSLMKLLGDPQDAARALELYRERFGEMGIFENEAYPAITETLAALHSNGRQLFVATSKPTVYAEKIISHFAWADFFDAVYGSELDGTRSDKSDLLDWIVNSRALEPEATIMVGDREHDIVAARNNHLRSLGVLYGYGSKSELEAAGADALCNTPFDLLMVLK